MTTSLSATPYGACWCQRQAEGRAHSQRLAGQGRADARAIAAMLRREVGVTRVLLFGLLAQGRFLPDSDISISTPHQSLCMFVASR